jgi:hypothetical protein
VSIRFYVGLRVGFNGRHYAGCSGQVQFEIQVGCPDARASQQSIGEAKSKKAIGPDLIPPRDRRGLQCPAARDA